MCKSVGQALFDPDNDSLVVRLSKRTQLRFGTKLTVVQTTRGEMLQVDHGTTTELAPNALADFIAYDLKIPVDQLGAKLQNEVRRFLHTLRATQESQYFHLLYFCGRRLLKASGKRSGGRTRR